MRQDRRPKGLKGGAAELVRTHSELLVEDAEKLAEHDKRLAEHGQWWKRHQIVMAEIEDKLNALIDHEMKRQAGPEAK